MGRFSSVSGEPCRTRQQASGVRPTGRRALARFQQAPTAPLAGMQGCRCDPARRLTVDAVEAHLFRNPGKIWTAGGASIFPQMSAEQGARRRQSELGAALLSRRAGRTRVFPGLRPQQRSGPSALLRAVAVAQTNRVVVPPQSPGREGPGRPHVRPSRSNRRPRWTRLTSGGNAPLLPQHNETPAAGVCATATAGSATQGSAPTSEARRPCNPRALRVRRRCRSEVRRWMKAGLGIAPAVVTFEMPAHAAGPKRVGAGPIRLKPAVS
jgi:hypothetical protein